MVVTTFKFLKGIDVLHYFRNLCCFVETYTCITFKFNVSTRKSYRVKYCGDEEKTNYDQKIRRMDIANHSVNTIHY